MQMLVHHAHISKRVCVVLICYNTVLFKSDTMLICIQMGFPIPTAAVYVNSLSICI